MFVAKPEYICQYNHAIDCDAQKCYHCGWDPDVAKARFEQTRKKELRRNAKAGEKQYRVPFTGYCEVWATSPEEAAEMADDIQQQFFAHYDYGDPVCLEEETE